MSRGLVLATFWFGTAMPRAMDDDSRHQAAFVEIANRIAPLIERIANPELKASAAMQLARYRISAKDVTGAKRALNRAADLAMALDPNDPRSMRRFWLIRIARTWDELGDRQAAASTLALARKAALEIKKDFFKKVELEMILDLQREQEDRDAVAETARRLVAIIKEGPDYSFAPKVASLLKVQAEAGDVRGALRALLETPTPADGLDERPEAERRDAFRGAVLRSLLYACRVGDEETVSRIAKLIRGMPRSQDRNSALRVLVFAQARMKQFDEATRTADGIDLKFAEGDIRDPRDLLIDTLLDLAEAQYEERDPVGAQRSARKAEDCLGSFETLKDRGDPRFRAIRQSLSSPLPRLIRLHARTGERAEALTLAEKLTTGERIKMLEEIADLDDDAGHRDDAAAVRKQAVKLANNVLRGIEEPAPPAEVAPKKPVPVEPPPDINEPPLLGPDGEIRKRTPQEIETEAAVAEAAARKARHDDAMLALIRLHVRMGDLNRAGELLKEAGEPRQAPTQALVRALGRSGDAATALTRIDAISDPEFQFVLLSELASGLQQRHKSKARDGGP